MGSCQQGALLQTLLQQPYMSAPLQLCDSLVSVDLVKDSSIIC